MSINLVIRTLIDDREREIVKEFEVGSTYLTGDINKRINKVLRGKFNQYTTTQIFKYIFVTEAKVVNINGEWDREYQITDSNYL